MNVLLSAPSIAPCLLSLSALLACIPAHATTVTETGTFTSDSSSYELSFGVIAPTNYTFATTSAAAGNFLPTLTLFNDSTEQPVDFNDNVYPGGDVSLTDVLGPGNYDLFLTEYPNVAVGKLNDGFLFSGDPTATGDFCGGALAGQSFVNAETCASAAPLGQNFSLDVTSSSVTPEPSSLLLVLAPAAGLAEAVRRRRCQA